LCKQSNKFEAFMPVRGRLSATMTSDTDTLLAEDPITGEEIELPADVEVGEIIDSPVTGTELEVISLDPVVLEEAPELEEDWGE
jgi:alpha-aminoadipate carrier protein LysW